MGKGEKARYYHFLHFSQCFQKPSSSESILDLHGFPKDNTGTVKPVLDTTCIKRPPALRDHCSDTITLLKAT